MNKRKNRNTALCIYVCVVPLWSSLPEMFLYVCFSRLEWLCYNEKWNMGLIVWALWTSISDEMNRDEIPANSENTRAGFIIGFHETLENWGCILKRVQHNPMCVYSEVSLIKFSGPYVHRCLIRRVKLVADEEKSRTVMISFIQISCESSSSSTGSHRKTKQSATSCLTAC